MEISESHAAGGRVKRANLLVYYKQLVFPSLSSPLSPPPPRQAYF